MRPHNCYPQLLQSQTPEKCRVSFHAHLNVLLAQSRLHLVRVCGLIADPLRRRIERTHGGRTGELFGLAKWTELVTGRPKHGLKPKGVVWEPRLESASAGVKEGVQIDGEFRWIGWEPREENTSQARPCRAE